MRYEKKKQKPKVKKVVSYIDAHNRAVNFYRKSAMFLFWAGIIAVGASIIGIVQMVAGQNYVYEEIVYAWPTSGFALGFSLEIFLARLFLNVIDTPALADVLIILVSLILGGGFGALGVFASKGKRWCLFLGGGLYLADFAALFFVYQYLSPITNWTNYAFSIATHVIVLSALIVAIIEYYRVIDIEKKFNGGNKADLEEKEESEVIAHG